MRMGTGIRQMDGLKRILYAIQWTDESHLFSNDNICLTEDNKKHKQCFQKNDQGKQQYTATVVTTY